MPRLTLIVDDETYELEKPEIVTVADSQVTVDVDSLPGWLVDMYDDDRLEGAECVFTSEHWETEGIVTVSMISQFTADDDGVVKIQGYRVGLGLTDELAEADI